MYPRSELALRHEAGVRVETNEGPEAYASFADDRDVPYVAGWLSERRR